MGKERSEKGGDESVRVSTCVGSCQLRWACFIVHGGGDSEERK
jgi:hypothetical protein